MCDTLRDLVSFVQFKKCEKHPWRSVNFSNFNFTVFRLNLYWYFVLNQRQLPLYLDKFLSYFSELSKSIHFPFQNN